MTTQRYEYEQKRTISGSNTAFWNSIVKPTVYRIKGNKCEICGAKKHLDIHHNDYKDEVTIHTLELLCRSCHKKIHNFNKKE